MKLTLSQDACITKLSKWWNSSVKYYKPFQISGAAGTGKTFIVKYFIEAIGLKLDEVAFMAFTGKAAMVMRENGLNATTIHASIYKISNEPVKRKSGEIKTFYGRAITHKVFKKRDTVLGEPKLIVLDEVSMVDERIGEDILSFKLPIIVLGDLNQLPPIMGKSIFLQKPDVVLDQIMRQAKDNPIIGLSQSILKGKIPHGHINVSGDILRIRNLSEIEDSEYLNNDIMIAGKNFTVFDFNKKMRALTYNVPEDKLNLVPYINDKLICRQNVWNKILEDGTPLVNGTIGYVQDVHIESLRKNLSFMIDFRPEISETDYFEDILLDGVALSTKELSDEKETVKYGAKPILFSYGYCITCHKSQGSQFKSVMVLNEPPFKRDAIKWLYTAVTRAREKLLLINLD